MKKGHTQPVSSDKAPRSDGQATRSHILEIAGKVFAEQGYESATSKEICIQANTNQAAVNYHFGSRDELYIAVLVEAHRRFISLDILSEIAGEHMSAQDKLARAIDAIIDNIADKGWHLRVFMREILFPSPLLKVLLANEVTPKLNLLKQWLSEITGIELDSPVLARCFLSTFSPCILLLIANQNTVSHIMADFWQDKFALRQHIKSFAYAGLQAIRDQEAK